MEHLKNDTAMGSCVPSRDSSAIINCPSFVADSVFDMELMSCTCTGPVIANSGDKQYPFSCGTVIDTTVIRCNENSRIDLLKGGCKQIPSPTKKPQPSTEAPTKKPMPSTEAPTKKPQPSSTQKPRRTDIIWRPEISRQPLPSLRPHFTPLRASPMPTPWRPIKPMEPNVERPLYIQSTLRLSSANETAIQKPEKLQEIQASIACSLRMPIENVRIMNITVLQRDGSRKVIIPDFTPLSGNGSVQCFTLIKNNAQRLLRSRTLQQTGSVDIDYIIIDPSVDILSLTPTEFAAIMGDSPSIASVAASVGSTGVSVSSESAQSSTETTTSSGSPVNIGAIAGGIVGSIAIAIVGIATYKITTRKKRIVSTATTEVVSKSNPLQTTSVRMIFTPVVSRTGV